jgi:hypothetical protein
MKNIIAFIIVAGLCVGCGDKEKTQPEVAEQKSENTSTNWEPEMAEVATATCPDGEHEGHNHKDENENNEHEGHDHEAGDH